MLEIKIGVQLRSLRQPFRQGLQTANRLQAQAVEIDALNELRPEELTQTGFRQVRKLLEDLNLRVSAIGLPTRRGYSTVEGLDARVDATKAAMRMAYSLGAPVVVNHVGRVPEESSGPEWELLVSVLHDLGLYGQKVGAVLAAETGSESGADLARLLAALPEGFLAVNFDPGNLIINRHSPSEAVRLLGPRILHVHAKDGVLDLAQGRGVQTPLGQGACDFPDLLSVLEEHHYRGYLTIERETDLNPEFEIVQAIRYLRSL